MSASTRTSVYYFVPEDGDDEAHPNFYTLGRPANKVRLGDVKTTFPLPGGYHFRFKKAFKNTYVWLDLLDDAALVPRFDNQIVAKVARLSLHGVATAHSQRPSSSSFRPVEHHQQQQQHARRGRAPSGGGNSSSSTPPPTRVVSPGQAASSKHHSGDLLGLNSSTAASNISAPVPVKPPAAGAKASPVSSTSAADALHSMDLDWSSSTAPSPSPSPPMIPTSSTPMMSTAPQSTSPMRRPLSSTLNGGPAPPPKASLSIPNDLSSAAKDFKL
mmetsp:Transcript_13710/g.26545  ORF Transcript_13710/g.26545 Transcript_13710/m.26545 type:complete len:272 (-) Transcript_13710:39-854(-)|eukprot:CAMPEP_0171553706 /NCGR_PEP_ID=MMETSP0960-20121227/9094_1 /TAXON_ID=87120 /ORGANISM="Aurantiochytrium limacinum, Strain ATCCMYA-1381" /LENGTH=271 /DNA_ID=CAMNT_0012103433 /DNA_START=209 /DNA_END=1024 /DNA_ORIENTATION=-